MSDYDYDEGADHLILCPICQDQYTTSSRCTSCAAQDWYDRHELGEDNESDDLQPQPPAEQQ